MATETERKFLLVSEAWRENVDSVTKIRQGYLARDKGRTIRVRVAGNEGYITIKGKTLADGITKPEYEYKIPKKDAEDLLKMCLPGIVEKTRHRVSHYNHVWEVDEFHGDNEGLIVAEIELKSADEKFRKPVWAGKEVTDNGLYTNASLSENPYKKWRKKR